MDASSRRITDLITATGTRLVIQQCSANFAGARDVFRKVRPRIGEIDESIRLDIGRSLPITGWDELLDELALQWRLVRL